MSRHQDNDDTRRAAKAAAIIGIALAAGALGLYGARSAFSVLVGAAIAVANLLTMRAIIRALIKSSGDEGRDEASPHEGGERPSPDVAPDDQAAGHGGGLGWGVFATFKILILFGGVWILLTRRLVDPMPLVVGYGVLPLGIVASTLWSSLRARR